MLVGTLRMGAGESGARVTMDYYWGRSDGCYWLFDTLPTQPRHVVCWSGCRYAQLLVRREATYHRSLWLLYPSVTILRLSPIGGTGWLLSALFEAWVGGGLRIGTGGWNS